MNLRLSNKIFLVFLLLSICYLSACTFNSSYINRKEDIEEGKLFLNRFYKSVANRNYNEIDNMSSDTLKKVIGQNGLSKITKIVYDKLGNYKKYSISDSHIIATRGSVFRTVYQYKLKVEYNKGVIDEMIGFVEQKDSIKQITSYNVYSDLLLKP